MERELNEWYELHKFYRYSDYLTKDLAYYLKVTPRTIQRWIKGRTAPTEQELILIKKYLTEKAKNRPTNTGLF